MKFNNSFLLTACLLSSFGIHAEQETALQDNMTQGTGNGITIFFVKSIKDFNAVVRTHEHVLACIFDSSQSVTSEMAQAFLDNIIPPSNFSIVCVIIDAQEMPSIKIAYPFNSALTLISFVDGQKIEQCNVAVEPMDDEQVDLL